MNETPPDPSRPARPAPADPPTAFASGGFRLLLATWLVASVFSWTHDAAVSWMLAAGGASPAVVALVQVAATLPVFLAVLPSGAMADLFDRRRILVAAYAGSGCFVCTVALATALATPPHALLLASSFVVGLSMAVRLPAQNSLVQDAVAPAALAGAVLWHSAALNAARLLGPLLAGLLLWAAPGWVTFLAVGGAMLMLALQLHRARQRLPVAGVDTSRREGVFEAMRVGLRFAVETPAVRRVAALGACQFFFAVAVLALLPVLVRDRLGLGATAFSLLYAAFGLGAVTCAVAARRPLMRWPRAHITAGAGLLQAACSLTIAWRPGLASVLVASFVTGFSWLALSAVLQTAVQGAVPAWVRARALSCLHMAFMGGSTLGSLACGLVASTSGLSWAFALAGTGSAVTAWLSIRAGLDRLRVEDVRPHRYWSLPELPVPAAFAGRPLTVAIDFEIDGGREAEFLDVMEESRRLRMRGGSLAWRLRRDLERPTHFTEEFDEANWAGYLRHRERSTVYEGEVRDRKLALHVGVAAPRVRFLLAQEPRAVAGDDVR